MTKTDGKQAFDFVVNQLKSDSSQSYADIKAKADKKGHTLYPVLYGNAQRVLGLANPVPVAKKRGRPAGSGSSKSDKIRELLQTGMSGADIAKEVGCSVNLVYNVKSKMKQAGGVASKASSRQAMPSGASTGDLDDFLRSVRAIEQERDELRAALKTIVDELSPLLA